MATPSDHRYVVLRGGLALPIEPVQLLLTLETRGFRLLRNGDDIYVRPFSQLTDDELRLLKQWKAHILALLDYDADAHEAAQ